LHGVSWATYERLLADFQDSHAAHFAYDEGRLEIMVLSAEHEEYKDMSILLVNVLAEEMDIDVRSFGSTTFQRADLERGFEPDGCFYIQHEAQVQGKIRIPLPSAQLHQASVKSILFHEYTHALLHDLTKARCPTWLNEGLAEYEGARYQARSLTRLAAAYQAQRTIPWRELSEHFSPTRSVEEIQFAYEQAYSMVSYLVQRYTFWRMRRVLAAIADGTPWEETTTKEFRASMIRLEQDWRQWLPTMLTKPSNSSATR